MAVQFDRWTTLKLFEVLFAISCLVCKRVTDDEESRLFLYLQKLSREWSLLNSVTWDQVGSAVADATYGGYIIITFALFIGRLFGELPTKRRIAEFILLGIGTILFIVLGSLEFAALDSVPENLVDNAAVLGTLTLITAALFILDMGGPKAKKPLTSSKIITKPIETRHPLQEVYDIEREIERAERRAAEANDLASRERGDKERDRTRSSTRPSNGVSSSGTKKEHIPQTNNKHVQNGYKMMRANKPKRFDIYGKDMNDYKSESETDEVDDAPRSMQEHSPVWSKIRKGRPIVDYVDTSSSRTKISHSILNEQL